jgi:flagellar biosynthesis GTPase FlhF
MADEKKLTELSPMDRAKRVAKDIYSRIPEAMAQYENPMASQSPISKSYPPEVTQFAEDMLPGSMAEARDLMIAYNTSDPMLAVLAGIGLTGVPAKEVVKVAKATGKSMAEVIKEARSYFKDDVLDIVSQETFPKNRHAKNMLIYMKPQEFLDMAPKLNALDPAKMASLDKAFEAGTKIDAVPSLDMLDSGQLWGHEGRHRASQFLNRGIERIPVQLRTTFRAGRQADPLDDDYKEILPQSVIRQRGSTDPDEIFKSMDAPYYTSGPRRGEPLPEYGGEAISPEAREEMTRLLEAGKTKEAARLAAVRAKNIKMEADLKAYEKAAKLEAKKQAEKVAEWERQAPERARKKAEREAKMTPEEIEAEEKWMDDFMGRYIGKRR